MIKRFLTVCFPISEMGTKLRNYIIKVITLFSYVYTTVPKLYYLFKMDKLALYEILSDTYVKMTAWGNSCHLTAVASWILQSI
jgi:hypothetical protein